MKAHSLSIYLGGHPLSPVTCAHALQVDTYLEDNFYICGVAFKFYPLLCSFLSLIGFIFAIMDFEEEVLPGQLCFNELKVLV